jgi:hypothetical protein
MEICTTSGLCSSQDYLPQGVKNQRYDGSKMTSSADFNINSPTLVMVVRSLNGELANGNQLIYQNMENKVVLY